MISRLTFGLLLVSGCLTGIIASQPAKTENLRSSAEIKEVVPPLSNNVMTSLDDYKWQNRLLLVFAPKEDATYQQQMQLFKEQQPGFDERDLLLVQLLAAGTSSINNQPIDAQLATQIRKRFNVADQEFQVILIGKDGTGKRRDRSPVSPEVIFDEIDAMPMRQQEMRSPN